MDVTKKIPTYQFVFLVIISEIMHQYTYMPVLNTIPKNQDSWLVALLSIPYAIVLCLPILFLLNKFKGVSFLNMVKAILGKTGGKIVTFIFLMFFCFCNISCLSLSIGFIRNYIFYNTPEYVLLIFILVPVCYIAIKGFVTISKLSVFSFISIVSTIFLFSIFSLNKVDITLLQPVLRDSNFLDLNIGAFITAARFSDILIIFIMIYRLQNINKINKVFLYSYVGFTIITVIMVLSTVATLGVKFAMQADNPYFTFTKQVDMFDFIQRIEAFNMISWLSGSILKVSVYHYILAFYLKELFNTKKHNLFVILSAILAFSIILIFNVDRDYIMNFISSNQFFPWMVLIFIFIIPIIILTVYLIRKKKINIKDYKTKENVGIID